MKRRRTVVMIAVYVLIIAHIVQWQVTGRTLGPFVASDAMETLENGVINGGFLILAAVLLLTVVLGRFLCGWACHMGGLQDLCAWLLKKVGIRPRLFRTRLLAWAPILLGLYMFVWPTFLREAVVPALRAWWPSGLAYVGNVHGFPGWSTRLSTSDMWERLPGVWVAIPFLLTCGFATVYFLGARGFCRLGCPYGGIMSPLEQLAPVRVKANLDQCDACGRCTAACASGVRVMEEIRAYGRVVSRDCTRTLDCVAVCPRTALALRWTRPALLRGTPKAALPRVQHDLTWPEEFLTAGAFALAFFTTRSLYDFIPMLMAVALAGCFAATMWKAWRLLWERDCRFAGMQLRRRGRFTAAGTATMVFAELALGVVVHSAAIRVMIWRAGVLDGAVTTPREVVFSGRHDLVPPEMEASAARSLRLYAAAAGWRHGGWGLTDTPTADIRAAWLHLVRGEYEPGETLMRRALARVRPGDRLCADVARVIVLRGEPDRAAAFLEPIVGEHADFEDARGVLCWVHASAGRPERAAAVLESALAARPSAAMDRARLASLYVGMGRTREALDHLQRAVADAPGNSAMAHDLAVVRYMTGDVDGAVGELLRASEADPAAAAGLLRDGAGMLSEAGRDDEVRMWLERAEAAERRARQADSGGGGAGVRPRSP